MKGTMKGFLMTAGAWVVIVSMYSIIELIMGDVPFAMLKWSVGGKFVTLTILFVMALGTAIGYASDRIQERMRIER
jgi:uncharacterized membrane protein